MIELSKRMQAVADMVPTGSVAADIGCDHGFVSIYLIQKLICPAVYAADVRPGPLSRAKEHIAQCGLEGYITPVLSDGLKEVPVRSFDGASGAGEAAVQGADGMLAAGMGGQLMIRILSDVPQKMEQLSWVVLEPQSDVELVRRWLWEHEFVITDETMVFEDGKYYPVMRALNHRWADAETLKEAMARQTLAKEVMERAGFSEKEIEVAADWLGGQLILRKSKVLSQFLHHTIENDKKVLRGLPQISVEDEKTEKGMRIAARFKEFSERVSLSERVLELMKQ